ncbi:MAG TPA: NAD(P)-dependent oxidoreductase [Acidisarcina sp.]
MTQTALVTGANGFIGSHLVQRLRLDGWNVAAVIHRHRGRLASLLDPQCLYNPPKTTEEAIELLIRVRPTAIFHLAAASASELPADVDQLFTTNIVLGAMLMEAACHHSPKPIFVMAGSFWEYADAKTYSPNTLYAAAKHCLYDLLVYYRSRHDLRAVSLVLFDTYGPDDPRDKLWSQLVDPDRGTNISLTPGEQLVELVHVRDVVSAFIHAAELLLCEQLAEASYAVRSPVRSSLRSIVENICKLTNSDIRLNWGAKQYRPFEIFDPWSGPLLPGWTTKVSLEEGISELIHSAS